MTKDVSNFQNDLDPKRSLILNLTNKWSNLDCLDINELDGFLKDDDDDEFSHIPPLVAGRRIGELPWEDLKYGDYLFPLHIVDIDMKVFLLGSMMLFLLRERIPSGRRVQAENVIATIYEFYCKHLNDKQRLWFREFISLEKEVQHSTLRDFEIDQVEPPTVEELMDLHIHPFDASVALLDVMISQLKKHKHIDSKTAEHYLKILLNEIQNMSLCSEDAWLGEYGIRAEHLIKDILKLLPDELVFASLNRPVKSQTLQILKRIACVNPETHPKSAALISATTSEP